MTTRNFQPFPELHTNQFRLRQLNKNDAKKIFELRSSKEVGRFLDRPIAKTMDDGLAFIKKVNGAISRNELIYWGITKKNDSEIIGTITLWQISKDGLEAEIGFELIPKFHGLGVMKEVLSEIIRFAFDEIHLAVIKGEVDPNNIKSIMLMKRFGFILEKNLEKTDIYYLRKTI